MAEYPLCVILWTKIAFTALLWATPALLAPRCVFRWLGFPPEHPDLFLRLLGGAYLALLVGYVLGAQSLKHGTYPADTIWVGIVSNGTAFGILATAAVRGAWSQWGVGARLLMWVSLSMTFLITVGLTWSGPVMHGWPVRAPS